MKHKPEDDKGGLGNLIVSRRVGEGLYIYRGIRITVLEIDAELGQVRLGIEAPQYIAISRDDIPYEQHMRWQRQRERSGAPTGEGRAQGSGS